ncbi:unnamed protein product [Clonostachys rosea]|uniref:Malonyl-CoA:ACP transacylase (MAT) domain-containing protein n=1 Tax=Bionectria ochroleuca TaxID=29856 RepID=A0ABY6TUK9_BIOOC|nr:unnamed protein product [Clonostachys rosea]
MGWDGSVRKSRDILVSLGAGWDLEEELLRDGKETKLNVAELAQPATTATQIAIVDVLRAQGIRPQAVVGHSSGDIAAAYTAGYMSHRAAIEVSFARGRVTSLAKTRCLVPGAMMSVGLGEHEIAPYMKDMTKGALSIACVNSPSNVTVSGDAEAMDELAGRLAASGDGVFHRRLVVDTAYHSHHMQAVADEYCRILSDQQQPSEEDQVHGQEEGITLVSSVTGSLKASNFSPEYWTTNLVSTVRFCDAVQFLVRKRASDTTSSDGLVIIEVGPHPALAGPVRQSIAGLDKNTTPEFTYYATLQRKKGAVESMLALASHLLESGVRLNFDHVSALTTGFHEANVLSGLPSYAWDHSIKHWHESRISREYRMRRDPYHDLLGVRTADSTSLGPRWRLKNY